MAQKHRLRALLYNHLNATCSEAVPELILNRLREVFDGNCRRNLLLTGELLKLLNLFAAHGISAIPYKGPALAVSVYGNLALREFDDLDIMVRTPDVLQAARLMEAHDYRRHIQLKSTQEENFLRHQSEHCFLHTKNRIAVDIHWTFEPRFFSFPLDPDSLRPRLQTLSLNGQKVLAYSPEDLFLLLSVHGAKHRWERLRWICDLAEMVRVYKTMDWEMTMFQARQLGVERMLLLGVYLAHDLLGTAFPDELMRKIVATPYLKKLAGQVQSRFADEDLTHPTVFKNCIFHLRARESWQDRLRYSLRIAIIPNYRDHNLLHLPRLFSLLYYAIRPFRLVIKYGLRLLLNHNR